MIRRCRFFGFIFLFRCIGARLINLLSKRERVTPLRKFPRGLSWVPCACRINGWCSIATQYPIRSYATSSVEVLPKRYFLAVGRRFSDAVLAS